MREFYVEFGGRLRERRRKAGMSQAQLAQRVGLSRTSITNIEKGHQQVSLHLFLSLAGAVSADPWDLAPSISDHASRARLPEGLLKGLTQEDQDWVLRVVATPNDQREDDHGEG